MRCRVRLTAPLWVRWFCVPNLIRRYYVLRRKRPTCRRCRLYEPATQTVFGEGPADAAVMFVGEQPGDQEDTIGRPFVGPAGQMMDRAMEEAGIDRRTVYVTNAVKHFKFTPARQAADPPDARGA